ncbi:MAG TPA: PH domain-containing protein [Alphaproteobacteria bacterium]|nr:PH domain-containing protein [Alphaproteobacteria bacterium]
MDYIRDSLTEDEKLIHIASFHWMYVFQAVFNIIFSICLAVGLIIFAVKYQPIVLNTPSMASLDFIDKIRALHPGVKILAFFVMVMGLLKFAQMMIIKATTEIGVTDCRLVYKRGLVARAVGELNIERIEGVNVLQGIMGRLFGYGRVMVHGTGVGEVVLPPIAQPIRFKKAIEKARTLSRQKGSNNTMSSGI